jgi:hypothetical protein
LQAQDGGGITQLSMGTITNGKERGSLWGDDDASKICYALLERMEVFALNELVSGSGEPYVS